MTIKKASGDLSLFQFLAPIDWPVGHEVGQSDVLLGQTSPVAHWVHGSFVLGQVRPDSVDLAARNVGSFVDKQVRACVHRYQALDRDNDNSYKQLAYTE